MVGNAEKTTNASCPRVTQYFIITLESRCAGYVDATVIVYPTETWKRCDALNGDAP